MKSEMRLFIFKTERMLEMEKEMEWIASPGSAHDRNHAYFQKKLRSEMSRNDESE